MLPNSLYAKKLLNPDVDVESFAPRIHLNVTEALLHDLSTFVIDNVDVNLFTMKVDVALSLPTLSLECNYAFGSGSAIADLFPLYGAGPARSVCLLQCDECNIGLFLIRFYCKKVFILLSSRDLLMVLKHQSKIDK